MKIRKIVINAGPYPARRETKFHDSAEMGES